MIVIEDWMIEDAHLGGLELLAFALIHGCTQKGDGCWHGGYERLAKRIGGSPRSAINAINHLIEIGFVKKGEGVIDGRKKSILTSNSSYEKISHEEISHEEISHSPMQKFHPNNINNIQDISISDNAHARENWRYLSSARKSALGFNPDEIAKYKRRLIAEELSKIAFEIKMPIDAQEKFLAKWCEHNPGSEKIKADYETVFNVKDRAIQFMGWWNQSRANKGQDKNNQPNINEKWGR